METQELSNEQLHQLLRDAKKRLSSKPKDDVISFGAIESNSLVVPKLEQDSSKPQPTSYITSTEKGVQVDSSRLVTAEQRKLANGIRIVQDPVTVKADLLEAKKATAGPEWFDLPKTDLTPQLKRDFQLLHMRGVLDPKRHYKKEANLKIPEYSQVGTVIEGPTEFFSARLTKKDRKRTLAEEILATEKDSGRFKAKYLEIQKKKTSGKKNFYKSMKNKRARKGPA